MLLDKNLESFFKVSILFRSLQAVTSFFFPIFARSFVFSAISKSCFSWAQSDSKSAAKSVKVSFY